MFLWVLGIKGDTLKGLPRSDLTVVHVLSIWLIVTFSLVATIVFAAMYTSFGQALLSVETQNGGFFKIALFLMVSVVIASSIYLFDRWLILGDFVEEKPLETSSEDNGGFSFGQISKKKTLKTVIRIGVSLVIAYSLGTLLTLVLLRGQIDQEVKRYSITKNADAYAKLELKEREVHDTIQGKRKILVGASQLLTENQSLLRSIDDQKKNLRNKIRAANERRDSHLNAIQAEGTGANVLNLDNISGDPGKGVNYNGFVEAAKIEAEKTERFKGEINILLEEERKINSRMPELVARRDAYQEQLNFQLGQSGLIVDAERNRLEASGQLILPTGGLLVRHSALERLKKDSETGASVILFSVMLKAVIMLLEMMPVLAKLIFPIPTALGLRLRNSIIVAQQKNLLETRRKIAKYVKELDKLAQQEVSDEYKAKVRKNYSVEMDEAIANFDKRSA